MKDLQRISASKIKTYRTCGKQYYYKYILDKNDRPDQDKNVGALLGTALHKAIEERYRNNVDPIPVFQQKMNQLLEEWNDAGYIIRGEEWFAKNLKDGTKMLRDMQWDFFNPLQLEEQFDLSFPDRKNPIALMNGYIDLIDTRGFIVDHKSQKELPTTAELDNDPQFIIYAWAYKTLYGHMPSAVYWNDLRTSKIIAVHMDNFEDKLKQLTYDIESMLNNTYYPRRLLDKVCKERCSFYQLCYGDKDGGID